MRTPITLLTNDDLNWSMGTQSTAAEYEVGCGDYKRKHQVDPYPGYPADLSLTTDLLAECNDIFPLTDAASAYFLLSHEDISRFNGFAMIDSIYKNPDGSEAKEEIPCGCGCGEKYTVYRMALSVVISGKRVPIHPAFLRYLIAHEYGHLVMHYLTRKLGYRDSDEATVYKWYMKERGLDESQYTLKYRGGHWHEAAGEIFANDARVLLFGRETDYWPHSVPKLTAANKPILTWWENACEKANIEFAPKV